MKIGKAAKTSGVSAKMIRYYESIGLVPCARRLKSGYRDYDSTDVDRLRLVRRARDAGFSLLRTGQLLRIWHDRGRADTKAIITLIAELENRAAATVEMVKLLRQRLRVSEGQPLRPHSAVRRKKGSRPLAI